MNHRYKLSRSGLYLLFLLVFFLQSCVKKEDFEFDKIAATTWTPDIAVPLVNSQLSIYDLVGPSDSGTVSIGSDSLVSLVYKGNIYSIYGYEFLPLVNQQDQQISSLNSADSTTLYNLSTVNKVINAVYPFSVANGEQLDSITLRLGTLIFHFQSFVPHSGTLHISIPAATFNGTPFSKDIPFSILGGIPVLALDSFDMAGYDVDFSSTGATNTLPINYTVTFNNSGTGQACTNLNFSIRTDFSNMRIARAFGNFGQRSLTVNVDSSRISIFNNSLGGTVYFDDPKMTFLISNSFGMPIDAHLTSLYSIQSSGPNIPVTGNIPDPLPINVPASIGQTANSSFFLDKNNSNIQTVVNAQPRYIGYTVNATSNLPASSYNFVEDSSRFKVDLDVDLPLKGYALGLTVQDTTDFSFDNIKEVQSAVFRINITNGFPASAYTQIYFTDSVYQPLDSMLINPQDLVIESALVDGAGLVIQPLHKMHDEPFNRTRLEHLFNAKKLLIRAVINTKDSPLQHVRIYSTYRLDVKIGVRALLSIQPQ